MKRSWLLAVALILVLCSSWFAHSIQTAGGTVKVSEVRFPGQDGKMLSALLYLPKNATNKTPAPAVLTMHGYINSRETQSGFNIEFARRGYVVLAMDMTGHGYSEQIAGDLTRGAADGLRHLAGLPFVDKANIATEAHSMGGWSTLRAALNAPDLVKTVILVGSSTETYGSGEVKADTKFNFGLIWGQYDEFWGLMWNEKGEMTKPSDIVKTAKLKKVFGTTENVEVGKLYGNVANESARKLYIPTSTHPGNHLDKESIASAIEFLGLTIPAPNPIDPQDQTWHLKEGATAVAFIGLVLFIFGLGAVLLQSRPFAGLVKPLNEGKPAKLLPYVLALLVGTAIPAATLFKFKDLALKDGMKAFLKLNAGGVSALFPQSITTQLAFWAVLNGAIALGIFLVLHYAINKRNGASLLTYGLKSTAGEIAHAFGFAVTLLVATQLLLHTMAWAFVVDARWWVVAAKPASFAQVKIFLSYLLPFLFYYLVSAVSLHSGRLQQYLDGKGFTTEMLVSSAASALGFAVLVALQVGSMKSTEGLFFVKESLWGIIAYQFVPLSLLTGAVSTYFYRKTGRVYAGAFFNALFVTLYIVAGQATQFAR